MDVHMRTRYQVRTPWPSFGTGREHLVRDLWTEALAGDLSVPKLGDDVLLFGG